MIQSRYLLISVCFTIFWFEINKEDFILVVRTISITLTLSLSLSLSIKQDKAAFIFCVEDRALFCQDCDEPIHSAGSLSANHQRFLATGIRVALSSGCNKETEKSSLEPPDENKQQVSLKTPTQQASSFSSQWALDEFLHFSDPEPSDKVRIFFYFKSTCIYSLQ